MAISTEPRPSIAPPIAPLPVEPPTEQSMQPAARPWADGTTALLIEHVTKRFKLGRKKATVSAVDDVSLSLIHISEPTRPNAPSRMPSAA